MSIEQAKSLGQAYDRGLGLGLGSGSDLHKQQGCYIRKVSARLTLGVIYSKMRLAGRIK